MRRITEQRMERITKEWGVRLDAGEVVICGSEADALVMAERRGGVVVKREVFETSWAEPAEG